MKCLLTVSIGTETENLSGQNTYKWETSVNLLGLIIFIGVHNVTCTEKQDKWNIHCINVRNSQRLI